MTFLVRWVHVVSASFLFGGALLIFAYCYLARRREDAAAARRTLLDLMQLYEWGFWAAVGLVVMTGVGNLGAFGQTLPDGQSDWGRKLWLKLALVAVLLVFSVLRTVSLAMTRLSEPAAPRRAISTLGGYYALTAALAVVITAAAVTLAHFPSL